MYHYCWVTKLSETGHIQWQKDLSEYDLFEIAGIKQTQDGSYIIAGTSYGIENRIRNQDYWICKLDDTGEIEWHKIFGGSSSEYLNTIERTVDGGYILRPPAAWN